MTGDLEDEAALDHPGNAVVKPLTVGFDPWEAHELCGEDNTTNSNSVTINPVELGIISTFPTCPSSPPQTSGRLHFHRLTTTRRTMALKRARSDPVQESKALNRSRRAILIRCAL